MSVFRLPEMYQKLKLVGGRLMNIALLEELVRKKAEHFQRSGIPVAEAIDRAGDEILNCMADAGGHGSRFCMRMCLAGAKKRVRPEEQSAVSVSEGDKWCMLIHYADRTLAI